MVVTGFIFFGLSTAIIVVLKCGILYKFLVFFFFFTVKSSEEFR